MKNYKVKLTYDELDYLKDTIIQHTKDLNQLLMNTNDGTSDIEVQVILHGLSATNNLLVKLNEAEEI